MSDRRSPEGGDHRIPGGAVRVARVMGVPVYVARSWLVVAVLITWLFAPLVENRLPDLGAARYLVSAAFAVLLYLSVLLHEVAHTVTALRLGLPVRRIVLQLLGGVSEIEREAETPGREFLIAFAGPLLSLGLGGLGVLSLQVLDDGTVVHLLALEVTIANLLVAGFNLLPGLPLDGGRVLTAAIWKITGRRYTGILAAAWIGRGVAVLVVAIPLLTAAGSGNRANPVDLIWALFIAAFIWMGATAAIRGARIRERMPTLSVRRLSRRAVPVAADLPLSEALRQANEGGAHALVVVDGGGRPTAIVHEAAVTATPEQRRPWVQVSSVARSLQPGLVLSVDLEGERLVDALRSAPATEYLVVDAVGDVYGVLAAADIERAFAGT